MPLHPAVAEHAQHLGHHGAVHDAQPRTAAAPDLAGDFGPQLEAPIGVGKGAQEHHERAHRRLLYGCRAALHALEQHRHELLVEAHGVQLEDAREGLGLLEQREPSAPPQPDRGLVAHEAPQQLLQHRGQPTLVPFVGREQLHDLLQVRQRGVHDAHHGRR